MNADVENAVIRMGDVATMLEVVDRYLFQRNIEEAERAVYILQEIFAERYDGLKHSVYGGERNG